MSEASAPFATSNYKPKTTSFGSLIAESDFFFPPVLVSRHVPTDLSVCLVADAVGVALFVVVVLRLRKRLAVALVELARLLDTPESPPGDDSAQSASQPSDSARTR